MQRLKAFPAAVINLVIRFLQYLLNELKHLALHVFKHPLGAIWWFIKMYLALMLLTLFVACSFGSMATELPYDPTDYVQAKKKQSCSPKRVRAPVPDTRNEDQTQDYQNWLAQIAAQNHSNCPEGNANYRYVSCSRSMTIPHTIPNCGSTQIFDVTRTTSSTQNTESWDSWLPPNGGWKSSPPNVSSQTYKGKFSVVEWDSTGEKYVCEEGLYTIGPKDVGAEKRCYRPKPNTCFESPDFQLANQYHFDPTSQGKGQVCVKSDNGENCPWKELPGSNGMFQPDVDNKNACDVAPIPPLSDPAEKPKDPEKCVPGGNGMMVCKADPNEKCAVNSTGAMSCPDSCGYMNGEFMCFTEPDIPDDPNKPPKKPVPEPDDNITDPLKKMADMNKQDLKEIQRGVESRLEGFSASMENSMNELAAQGKNAEKAAGVGNKLLNSINQNTADTVKELKKLTGDESNPQPNYEETELGEKNDWQVRNFGTVMKAAGDKIMEKPMFQAIDGYFDVSFGGTCPTWNVSVWVFEVEINQFCDQSFQAILPLIRNVVILIFSILAFRVAFL